VQAAAQYPDQAKTFLAQRWAERRGQLDADDFLLEALAVLSEDFRAGLAAFDGGRYRECADVMARLKDDLDPYLGTNAAAYEIKALVAADALPEAEARIDALSALPARLEQYSLAGAEVTYLKGYCALGSLKYAEAAAALSDFLDRFPDASQRLRMSATQMLAELRQRVPDRLGDVTDLMDYSARRLANDDTGEPVRQRQDQVIELLDKLIDEAEQQEQQSSSSGGSSQQPGGQNQRNQSQPRSPMRDSTAPAGRARSPGSQPSRPAAQPGQAWGSMQPAERERIIQALKDRFPERYRQLVEQYYVELAREP